MNRESIDNGFALPPPRAASYLPAPYGVRRGVMDRFAHLSPGGVYLPATRPRRGGAVAATAGAADFGHDNLAWSRTPPRRAHGRVLSGVIGGALLGAALTVLFGGALADRWAGFGHAVRESQPARSAVSGSIVAAAVEEASALRPESASGPASALTPALASASVPAPTSAPASVPPPTSALASVSTSVPAPTSSPASISTPPAAPTANRSGVPLDPTRRMDTHAVPASRPTPARSSDMSGTPVREREAVRPLPVRTALPRLPAKPRPAAPPDTTVTGASDSCGADWPCGDALRSLQAELMRWDASRPLPASADSLAVEMPVRLTDHPRVTEW